MMKPMPRTVWARQQARDGQDEPHDRLMIALTFDVVPRCCRVRARAPSITNMSRMSHWLSFMRGKGGRYSNAPPLRTAARSKI